MKNISPTNLLFDWYATSWLGWLNAPGGGSLAQPTLAN